VEVFLDKLREFNKNMNDIPRRAMIVVLTFLSLMLVWASFKYLAPLVVALVFSWLVKPIAKPMERLFRKIHIPQKLGALIATLLVFGVLGALLVWLCSALAGEAKEFLASLPGYIEDIVDYVTKLWNMASERIQDQMGDQVLDTIYNVFMTAINKVAEIASNIAAWMVTLTINLVAKLPDVIIFVLFMIMECYYVVADRHDIGNFFRKLMPEKVADAGAEIKDIMVSGVKAQFITAVLQMVAAAFILAFGFTVMGLNYALMLALIISVLDALPVIGAGLIMFPMMGYYLVTGQFVLLAGAVTLYLIVQVVKRVMEPKLLGTQMSLNQLATMVAMYAGFEFMGYIGLLIGPLMLKLFMAILNSAAREPAKPQPVIDPDKASKKSRRKI